MSKKAVSLTLEESNLLWLEGLVARSGARSLSEAVDRLITSSREGGAGIVQPRCVVGTIDIDRSDPLLDEADRAVRAEFERSLSRPFLGREPRGASRARSRRPRGRA